jgi:hypothetical protein
MLSRENIYFLVPTQCSSNVHPGGSIFPNRKRALVNRSKVSVGAGAFLAFTLALGGGITAASAVENADGNPDDTVQVVQEVQILETTVVDEASSTEDTSTGTSEDPPANENEEQGPLVSDTSNSEQQQKVTGNPNDNGPPEDLICEFTGNGWQTKVDTPNPDPATVPYTAPEGKLVAEYCVKAGPGYETVQVTPPSATVTIDHPVKDSVSHYQVRLVDAPDEPVEVELKLTYMQQKLCEGVVASENTWRIRNSSDSNVAWTTNLGQSGVAEPGDSFFTSPAGNQTMILSWGGGDSGFAADSTTKAGGTNITLPSDDPLCAPVEVELKLTYMQQKLCEGVVASENTWRIRNSSDSNVAWTTNLGQSGVAEPGDSFFTSPAGNQTMILSWGGGDSGFATDSTTKAGGTNITLPSDDPECAEEPEEVAAYIDVLVEKGCGFIEYTFVNETDEPLGENEFARTVTWTYTDENGDFVEFDQEANSKRVTVTVEFAEDQGGGSVESFAGEKGQQLRVDDVDTDCEDPPVKEEPKEDTLAYTGSNGEVINGSAALVALLLAGGAGLVWLNRRRAKVIAAE